MALATLDRLGSLGFSLQAGTMQYAMADTHYLGTLDS